MTLVSVTAKGWAGTFEEPLCHRKDRKSIRKETLNAFKLNSCFKYNGKKTNAVNADRYRTTGATSPLTSKKREENEKSEAWH